MIIIYNRLIHACYQWRNNGQCDYPGNVNCSSQFTDAPGATTRKSEYLPTTPSSIVTLRVDPNTPVQHPPFTVAPGATTQKSEYLPTTPSSTKIPDVDPNTTVVTCRDSTSILLFNINLIFVCFWHFIMLIPSLVKLNEKECVGPRPDLCKQGSGRYAAPDCRYYIQCTGVNADVARCPGGFTFDPVGNQCDWPNKNPACLQSCTESGYFDKPKSLPPTPSVTLLKLTNSQNPQKLFTK